MAMAIVVSDAGTIDGRAMHASDGERREQHPDEAEPLHAGHQGDELARRRDGPAPSSRRGQAGGGVQSNSRYSGSCADGRRGELGVTPVDAVLHRDEGDDHQDDEHGDGGGLGRRLEQLADRPGEGPRPGDGCAAAALSRHGLTRGLTEWRERADRRAQGGCRVRLIDVGRR